MRSPKVTTSMESAITSRLTRDAFIPSVPMEMPSLMVIVPNSKGTPSAWRIPSLTAWAQPVQVDVARGHVAGQVGQTATKGLSMSSRVRPIAVSMARAGARSGPSVISRLRCFRVHVAVG